MVYASPQSARCYEMLGRPPESKYYPIYCCVKDLEILLISIITLNSHYHRYCFGSLPRTMA